jgi:hypothetical protein
MHLENGSLAQRQEGFGMTSVKSRPVSETASEDDGFHDAALRCSSRGPRRRCRSGPDGLGGCTSV